MSGWWVYMFGVLTIPAVFALGVAALFVKVIGSVMLARHGLHITWRRQRHLEPISDFTLRHDIWWERHWVAVFAGGWYREKGRYEKPDLAIVSRWIGLGRPNGPCVFIALERTLGDVAKAESVPA